MKKIFAKFIAAVCCVMTIMCSLVGILGCAKSETVEIMIKFPRSLAVNSLVNPEIKGIGTFFDAVIKDYLAYKNNSVSIRIEEFEPGQEEKAITNAIDTADAADILYDDFFNMVSYIHSGHAVPLDDVLSGEQMADLSSRYLDSGKMHGKQYALPFLARQNILIYNKRIMRACGLDVAPDNGYVIENWSIEKWTDVLDTLAVKLAQNPLPDGVREGSYPMMMYAKDNQGDTHIMTLLRAFGSDLYNDNDRFALASDEKAIKALEWIQQGVSKDWYMPLSQEKTMTLCGSKFKNDELVFYNFNLGSSQYAVVASESGKSKYGFVNYPGGENGKCTFFCDGFEVFDNGDERKLATAKEFVNFVYSTEKWLECSAGCIPISKKVMDKYKSRILMLDEYDKNAANSVDFLRGLPNWQGTSTSVRSVFYKEIARLLTETSANKFLATPEKCAEKLDAVLNNAIDIGFENSILHK